MIDQVFACEKQSTPIDGEIIVTGVSAEDYMAVQTRAGKP